MKRSITQPNGIARGDMDSTRHDSRRFARSIVSNWGTFLFSAITNFVLSPIVVRALGDTQYGAWVLLVSMVGYLGLLDLGVRSAVTRYMAQFHASGDHERASLMFSSASRIFALAGAVAVLVSVVMAALLNHVFNVPPELLNVSRVVAIVSGVSVAISLMSGVLGGVLIGLERFDYYNAIEIVIGTIRALGILVTVRTGHGLIVLALVQLAATVLRAGANLYYTRQLYPELQLTMRVWDSASAQLIFKFGLTASFLHVMGSVMLYSDSLVIGAYLPIGMVTYFAIAGNLTEYARSVVTGVSQTLTPRMSALHAGGSQVALQQAVLVSARLSSLVVLPIATTLILRGTSFIALWMGPAYAPLAGKVLIVLALTLVPLSGYQVVTAAMFGISKHGGLVPIFVAEALTNLVLSILLVPRFGVIGSAMGTLVPRLVVSIIVGPWYMKRALGVSLRVFWWTALVLPVVAMIPFIVATIAIERYWPAHNLVVFFSQVLLILPLAAISAWFICLTDTERQRLRHFFPRFTRNANAA